MTDVDAIVTTIRRTITLLAEIGDGDATLTAQVLKRLLAGEKFESAADLMPGWRQQLRQAEREKALNELMKLNPAMDDHTLARSIVSGIKQAGACATGKRPDGEAGYFHDLARVDALAVRTWRRLIGERRGQLERTLAARAMALWCRAKPET